MGLERKHVLMAKKELNLELATRGYDGGYRFKPRQKFDFEIYDPKDPDHFLAMEEFKTTIDVQYTEQQEELKKLPKKEREKHDSQEFYYMNLTQDSCVLTYMAVTKNEVKDKSNKNNNKQTKKDEAGVGVEVEMEGVETKPLRKLD